MFHFGKKRYPWNKDFSGACARFANEEKGKNILVSKNLMLSLVRQNRQLNGNVFMIGTADEMSQLLKANMMLCNQNYIIPCYTEHLYNQTSKMLEQHGYHVQLLDLEQAKNGVAYNPFLQMLEVDGSYNDSIDDFVQPFFENDPDPFDARIEKFTLSLALGYLKMLPASEQTVDKLFEILSMGNTEENPMQPWEQLFGNVKHLQSYWQECRKFTVPYIHLNARSHLVERLSVLRLPTIKSPHATTQLDLDWHTGQHALFIQYPKNHQLIYDLLPSLYTQIIAAMRRYQPQYPVLIGVCGDFCIPSFAKHLLGDNRQGIRFVVHTNNISDFQKLYGELCWDFVVDSCDTLLYTSSAEPANAQFVVDELLLRAQDGKRPVPEPDIHLQSNQCIVMMRGVLPFIDKKV